MNTTKENPAEIDEIKEPDDASMREDAGSGEGSENIVQTAMEEAAASPAPEETNGQEQTSREKPKRNAHGLFYTLFAVSAALLAATFNFFLLLKNSDLTDIDGKHITVLYRSGAQTTIFIVFTVVVVFLLFSSAFFFRRTKPLKKEIGDRVSGIFLCAASGVALLSLIVMQFLLKKQSVGTPYELKDVAFSLRSSASMQKIALVLAGFSAFYFIIPLFAKKRNRVAHILRIICGMALVFFFCSEMLVTNSFMNDFLFSPIRLFSICSYCFLVFFVLSDLRMQIENRETPGSFAASGLIAFFVVTVEALPKLALGFMNEAGCSFGLDSFYMLMKLFVGLYALSSVQTVLNSREKLPKPENAVEAASVERVREEEVSEETPERLAETEENAEKEEKEE